MNFPTNSKKNGVGGEFLVGLALPLYSVCLVVVLPTGPLTHIPEIILGRRSEDNRPLHTIYTKSMVMAAAMVIYFIGNPAPQLSSPCNPYSNFMMGEKTYLACRYSGLGKGNENKRKYYSGIWGTLERSV